MFQSLSRDSGRLNDSGAGGSADGGRVSIPQSGFGAFEPLPDFTQAFAAAEVSIPQSGFGAFERLGGGAGGKE